MDLGLVTVVFAVVCGAFLVRALGSTIPGGWDGVAHFAIASVYARNGFPNVTGWMPEYFAGMPYPNFYPPVFYMVVAALAWVGVPLKAAFFGVQAASSLAVPLLTYGIGRRLAGSRIAGLVAGALTCGLLVDHNPLWRMGITLPSTFDAGLSTQLLGHVFLLAFFLTLLGAEQRRAEAVLCAVFFALVPLTNVHMVWVAAFLFVPHVAVRALTAPGAARKQHLFLYGTVGVIAVLLAAPWAVPMVARLAFVPTQALPPPGPGVVAFAFLRFGAYWVFALAAAGAKRDGRPFALGIGLLLLLAFTVLPSARWLALEHLAIQPSRVVIPFPFLMTPLVGYLAAAAGDLVNHPAVRPAAAALAVAIFYRNYHLVSVPEANVTTGQAAEYENALGALDGRSDGRVLVEMGEGGMSDGFAMQALAGTRGAQSLTTVFRESALNVLFAVPLRNIFSASVESFGIDHKLRTDELVLAPAEIQRRRLALFNVRYFAVQSDVARRRLQKLGGARRLSPPGRWELWGLDAEAPGPAIVPAWSPFLTFTSFSVKPRPDDGLDFVRLGEEMFTAGRLDVPLVHAPCKTIDGCADLARFDSLLLVDYPCADCDRARDEVVRFAERGAVVLVDSDAPLFRSLKEALSNHPRARWVGRTRAGAPDVETRRAAARETATWILDAVEAVRVPLVGAPRVTAARLAGDTAEIELDRAPERPVPVWVRQGFFPSWKNEGGSPVYLATPTFQLTFVDRARTTLRFGYTAVDVLGRALGLAGLAALALWIRRLARGQQGASPAPDSIA